MRGKFTILAGIAGLAVLRSAIADNDMRQRVDIDPQTLETALRSIAQAQHLQFLYTADSTHSLLTNGAHGNLSVHETLTRLLAGSAFGFRDLDGRTIAIVLSPPSQFAGNFRLTQLLVSAAPTQRTLTDSSPEQPTNVAASSAAPEEVVITGSRLITNGNDAPTPVTVVTPDQIGATKPTTLFEDLAELPMFSGSGGSTQAVTAAPNGQNSVSALNLRNIGAQRALVLFDGHREPPSTPDGFVDVNQLPEMLIQRVDVVTGGASAVYGSDAVTGVVNFITDTKDSRENNLTIMKRRGLSRCA